MVEQAAGRRGSAIFGRFDARAVAASNDMASSEVLHEVVEATRVLPDRAILRPWIRCQLCQLLKSMRVGGSYLYQEKR